MGIEPENAFRYAGATKLTHDTRKNGNLNVPGPLNKDTHEGWVQVANVHQIHFHLDKGSPDQLIPKREIQRTLELVGAIVKKP